MAKVLQPMGYITRQKKKYGLYTLLLILAMLSIYITGIIITGSQKNFFTIMAILFTLAVAQIAVRFLVYLPYKDGNPHIGKLLEELPEEYTLFHSVLITDGKGNDYFDHIVISQEKTYCISTGNVKNDSSNNRTISRIFERRGMKGQLEFILDSEEIDSFIQDARGSSTKMNEQQNEMIQTIKQYSL